MHRFHRAIPLFSALFSVAIVAACSSNTNLPQPTDANIIDTTTMWALNGTAVTDPSGFSIPDRTAVRTDQSSAFDFVFNIDNSGKPVFLPIDLLGLGAVSGLNPGLYITPTPFDSIRSAVTGDMYVFDDTVNVVVGSSYYARSRVVCTTLSVPQYGKIEVLAVDPAEKSITIRYLVNNNCGYLSLELGFPRN
jgi:hypothetical protein